MDSTDTGHAAAPVQPLTYATPQPREPRRVSGAGAIVAITFFVSLASVIIFIVVCESMRSRGSSGNDLWPAAVAVLGLAGMGMGSGFFLTRSR